MSLPDRYIARITAFSLTGAINTVVGIGVIVVASFLGAGVILANIVGYVIGLGFSFTLNSRITFQGRIVDRRVIVRFLTAFVVSFSINLATVILMKDLMRLRKPLDGLVGTPLYFVMFYMLCEFWVFRRDMDTKDN